MPHLGRHGGWRGVFWQYRTQVSQHARGVVAGWADEPRAGWAPADRRSSAAGTVARQCGRSFQPLVRTPVTKAAAKAHHLRERCGPNRFESLELL